MSDFLDVSERLLSTGALGGFASHFQRVFTTIASLQLVHSKPYLDLNNIEKVFSCLEMAETLGLLPNCSPDEIRERVSDLKKVISITLEKTVMMRKSQDGLEAPGHYGPFAELLRDLLSCNTESHRVSVLTFNYDLGIDAALALNNLSFDYGLQEEPKPRSLPLLKLHGSLNWAQCEKCGVVVATSLKNVVDHLHQSMLTPIGKVPLEVDSLLQRGRKCPSCGGAIRREPVLVPPTWAKGEYHQSVRRVWQQAAARLHEADNIFVIGYSMPPTDEFFRYLYALGTAGGPLLKRFWVFDPDKSGEVRVRYDALLGLGARSRFSFHPGTFREAITIVRQMFLQPPEMAF
mgnify:CR=1 FL=1